MVPRYDYFVLVRQLRQPCQLRLNLGQSAPVAEVSGVEEKVAGGNWRLSAVGI